ncbi:hypothetical protein CFC21_082393 [Triticum aestivum]|uniref:Pentacotripeptide-repeat region of PRORP domain-containing protein n=2 Tax=Triticum aestivum TaxID=4565 RepID=A0A9R1L4Y2_WHEAT|nr:hypothetical protein CFC21_082393 [Triticum aestivum]
MSRLHPRYFSSSVSSLADELLSEFQHHLGSGTLSPQLAHQLFDGLLRQPVPVSARALNGLFAALARTPPSTTCADGPARAIDLFNRMARAGRRRRVIAPTSHTYSILIECCCLARRPDLGPSFFAHLLKTGVTADVVIFSGLFKCLCDMKRTEEALDVLLHRVPHDLPNVISYSLSHGLLCKHGRIKEAEEIFYSMAVNGRKPDIVSYPIMLHGYAIEGSLVKMIDLCELMAGDRIIPNVRCFNILINAYAKHGMMDVAMLFFEEMLKQGVNPNEFTYLTVISAFCKMGRMDDAMQKFNEMIDMGVPPDTEVYMCMVEGYLNHVDSMKANKFITKMKNRDIHHRPRKDVQSLWLFYHRSIYPSQSRQHFHSQPSSEASRKINADKIPEPRTDTIGEQFREEFQGTMDKVDGASDIFGIKIARQSGDVGGVDDHDLRAGADPIYQREHAAAAHLAVRLLVVGRDGVDLVHEDD